MKQIFLNDDCVMRALTARSGLNDEYCAATTTADQLHPADPPTGISLFHTTLPHGFGLLFAKTK
jgi:hypothetical protein